MVMIKENETWEVVEKPLDRKIIGVKWVFRTKLKADGSINKNKVGLVVKFVDEFKEEIMQVLEMTDLGLMSYFLGMEIKQSKSEEFICQKKYAKEILKKFQMKDCKPTSTPMNQNEKYYKDDGADKVDEGYYRSLIGCLMYRNATRPYILFVIHCFNESLHYFANRCTVFDEQMNYFYKQMHYSSELMHCFSKLMQCFDERTQCFTRTAKRLSETACLPHFVGLQWRCERTSAAVWFSGEGCYHEDDEGVC
ncbi:uncharacterized protein LOC124898444 [Capsicum annuum]|uniref:uncharacterized protein LOC124898444 n=1 Tax=Capsicum annuum TaxID=4072 RepID=UPI001FB0DC26|nr:uncharacterized protein LOC124898444 [Capsicum annuum]